MASITIKQLAELSALKYKDIINKIKTLCLAAATDGNVMINISLSELAEFDKYKRPEDWIKIITSVEGVGKFLAHEIYIDCCYFNKYICNGSFPFTENDHSGAEMFLCEFFKWWKMKLGEGKQRARFSVKTKPPF